MSKKKKMQRVEGSNTLYRNESGAIVNTDTPGFTAYIKKRNATRASEEQLSSLTAQLIDAKDEIEQLKELVKKALEIKQS